MLEKTQHIKDHSYVIRKIIFQRSFKFYFFSHFLFMVFNASEGIESSLAERKLLKIIELEKKFFHSNLTIQPNKKELSRKAQDLVGAYDAYLAENPSDTNALILYGKFLNKVGQESHAIGFFLRADELNPKIAVVKQQIGNFLVEDNKPLDALPFFSSAIEIDPTVPEYHFHMGNFLHLFSQEISNSGILGKKSVESFAHDCFRQAAKLKSNSFEFRLRFAQSFFDFADADYALALKEWENLKIDFKPSLSKSELDYIKLCKARIMLELNQKDKATSLLNEVSTRSLVNSKNVLLKLIKEKLKSDKVHIEEKNPKKTGFFKPLLQDPHLARLKKVTEKLREENLIKQLDIDKIQVLQDTNGHLKLIVNQHQ